MIALHGFLGLPEDWTGILPEQSRAVDWWPYVEAGPNLLDRIGERLAAEHPDETTLLGYSMGGRIALHMLVQNPDRWQRAVIVSASPGIPETERPLRLMADENWANRFREDDWNRVIADWNGQTVFQNDPRERSRDKAQFDRERLAIALVDGSVAKQRDLRTQLATINSPILWIAGERDPKYAALAHECASLSPSFQAAILPNAGHRAPWGNPAAFRSAIQRFITITP